MLAHVRGVPVDTINDHYYGHSHDHEIEKAVATRQEVHEEELLAESPRGQSILRLREERENLLDVVWLATSGADLRLLWSKVTALLGDQPTQLGTGRPGDPTSANGSVSTAHEVGTAPPALGALCIGRGRSDWRAG